jgi:hypothetical protein
VCQPGGRGNKRCPVSCVRATSAICCMRLVDVDELRQSECLGLVCMAPVAQVLPAWALKFQEDRGRRAEPSAERRFKGWAAAAQGGAVDACMQQMHGNKCMACMATNAGV